MLVTISMMSTPGGTFSDKDVHVWAGGGLVVLGMVELSYGDHVVSALMRTSAQTRAHPTRAHPTFLDPKHHHLPLISDLSLQTRL